MIEKLALSRRSMLCTMLAMSACDAFPQSSGAKAGDGAAVGPLPPLRTRTQVPIGCCITTKQIDNRNLAGCFIEQFSQLTPEYEMKMGAMLRSNGDIAFDDADLIASFAQNNGMRLHGHTLVWQQHQPAYFRALDKDKGFESAYRDYITKVVGHFKGSVCGWDVVNEPVLHDGSGLKPSLWGDNLGEIDYIVKAFETAAAADPGVPLFLNEYGLEANHEKRHNYMRLIETLLKRGVPLGGIGSQTHLDIDIAPGEARQAIRDLASFHLPIHISEVDISLAKRTFDSRPLEDRRLLQAKLMTETADAFFALPPKQRYAFTLWGLSDADSYLMKPPFNRVGDEPNIFDANLRPKILTKALADSIKSAGT